MLGVGGLPTRYDLGLQNVALESCFTGLGVLYDMSESKSHILVHSDTATVRLQSTQPFFVFKSEEKYSHAVPNNASDKRLELAIYA